MKTPGLGEVVFVVDARGDEYRATVVQAPPGATRGSFPKVWLRFAHVPDPMPWPADASFERHPRPEPALAADTDTVAGHQRSQEVTG